jgi:hypothetical protein
MSQPRTRPPKLRLEKLALFEDLEYRPHEGQIQIHKSTARRRVLACGTRFGKSVCAAYEVIAGLLEPRESTLGWICAPTYELTKRVWQRVAFVLQERLSHRVLEIAPREQRIRVVNLAGGVSELRGKSADQPAGLLGEELDFLVVDEATQLRSEVWTNYLSARLIDRQGWSLLLSTPAGPGWFYEEFKRGKRNRDPGCESWSMPTWTNPHMNRETIEAERGRLPEEAFKQQYEATFVGVPDEPCETCGGPREDAIGKVTAPEGEYKDDFIPRCPECGIFVDSTGRCIVKKFNEWHASFWVNRPWTPGGSANSYDWY